MTRADAIRVLESHADAIRAMGGRSLYLFGSTARDEATAESDLDIFIEDGPERRFSLLDLAGVKVHLEDRIGAEVQVLMRGSLHPRLRDAIERDAIGVF